MLVRRCIDVRKRRLKNFKIWRCIDVRKRRLKNFHFQPKTNVHCKSDVRNWRQCNVYPTNFACWGVNVEHSKLRCTQSKQYTFWKRTNGLTCCHVDSFLQTGKQTLEKKLFLTAGKVEERMFTYIGFLLKQTKTRTPQ